MSYMCQFLIETGTFDACPIEIVVSDSLYKTDMFETVIYIGTGSN